MASLGREKERKIYPECWKATGELEAGVVAGSLLQF